MPGLNGISSTVLLVSRLGRGRLGLPSFTYENSVAFAGPSQLPMASGVPLKLMRPSGQRGAGFGAGAGGASATVVARGGVSCARTARLTATTTASDASAGLSAFIWRP